MRGIDSVNREDNINAFEALGDSGIVKVAPSDAKLSEWRVLADRAVHQMLDAQEITAPQLSTFEKALERARQ